MNDLLFTMEELESLVRKLRESEEYLSLLIRIKKTEEWNRLTDVKP
jgi:hypothetical protein